MPVSAESLRQHIAYNHWANQRLLNAAAALTEEERTHDFGTADRSISGTILHNYFAEILWLARLEQRPKPDLVEPADWPANQAAWTAWASKLTDPSALDVLDYQDLKGRSWSTPVWQIVLHVVNHSTHHRGQTAGFIRSLGHVPPTLDLIAYYRGL